MTDKQAKLLQEMEEIFEDMGVTSKVEEFLASETVEEKIKVLENELPEREKAIIAELPEELKAKAEKISKDASDETIAFCIKNNFKVFVLQKLLKLQELLYESDSKKIGQFADENWMLNVLNDTCEEVKADTIRDFAKLVYSDYVDGELLKYVAYLYSIGATKVEIKNAKPPKKRDNSSNNWVS